MADVTFGVIPNSKIKSYAEESLGLIGAEVDLFISIMRRVERMSTKQTATDPEMKDQASAGDATGVKGIVNRLAPSKDKPLQHKKPRVRHPR